MILVLLKSVSESVISVCADGKCSTGIGIWLMEAIQKEAEYSGARMRCGSRWGKFVRQRGRSYLKFRPLLFYASVAKEAEMCYFICR